MFVDNVLTMITSSGYLNFVQYLIIIFRHSHLKKINFMIFFRSPRFTVYYNCVYNTVTVTSTCRIVVERPAVWCNEKKSTASRPRGDK
jgi:hypothetical protein